MRNVGQTSHISVSTFSMLIGSHFCSIQRSHSLTGCPMGEDKQEVKEIEVLLGFTPGNVLLGLYCTRLDLAHVHLSHPA